MPSDLKKIEVRARQLAEKVLTGELTVEMLVMMTPYGLEEFNVFKYEGSQAFKLRETLDDIAAGRVGMTLITSYGLEEVNFLKLKPQYFERTGVNPVSWLLHIFDASAYTVIYKSCLPTKWTAFKAWLNGTPIKDIPPEQKKKEALCLLSFQKGEFLRRHIALVRDTPEGKKLGPFDVGEELSITDKRLTEGVRRIMDW